MIKNPTLIVLILLLLSLFFLSGCTEQVTSLPYTTSQLIARSTDLNYTSFLAGDYNGLCLGIDSNIITAVSCSTSGGSGSWNDLTDFPTGCSANQAVQVIGTTLTCIDLTIDTNFETAGYDFGDYVPYVGASQTLDMGSNNIYLNGNLQYDSESIENYISIYPDGMSIIGADISSSSGDISQWNNDTGYITDISGQDLSTADNLTSQFITQGDIDWATNVPLNETDPYSLLLDQSSPQSVSGGMPYFEDGIFISDAGNNASLVWNNGANRIDISQSVFLDGNLMANCLGLLDGNIFCSFSDLPIPVIDFSPYVLLDGSNQPFTGDVSVDKNTPRIEVNDLSGTSKTIVLEANETDDASYLKATTGVPSGVPTGINVDGVSLSTSDTSTFDFDSNDAFSIEFWISGSTTYSFASNVWLGTRQGSGAGWDLSLYSSNNSHTLGFLFQLTDGSGNYMRWSRTTALYSSSTTNGAFKHVVITYDGAGTSYLYVNDTQYSGGNWAKATSGTLGDISNGQALRIGSVTWADPRIDELVFWNKALSPSEVSARYNASAGLYTTETSETLAIWHFDNSQTNSVSGGASWSDVSGTSTYVNGVVVAPAQDTEVKIIEVSDGVGSGVEGEIKFGNNTSETIISGGDINFDVGSTNFWSIGGGGDLVSYNTSVRILADNECLYLGADGDSKICYNGSDMIITPNVVGGGYLGLMRPIIDEFVILSMDTLARQLWANDGTTLAMDWSNPLFTGVYNNLFVEDDLNVGKQAYFKNDLFLDGNIFVGGIQGITHNSRIVKDVNVDGTFYCDMNYIRGILIGSDC